MNNAPIERMKKILALARRGVDGEKATAEAMLSRLMSKYGVTLAELEGGDAPREIRLFHFANDLERRLLIQCAGRVLNVQGVPYRTGKRWRSKIGFNLTAVEYAELDLSFGIWREALAKHVDLAFVAFVNRNRIFPDAPTDVDEDRDDPPPRSAEDLAALEAMMRGTKKTDVVRMIGGPA